MHLSFLLLMTNLTLGEKLGLELRETEGSYEAKDLGFQRGERTVHSFYGYVLSTCVVLASVRG